jgi:hypothetical protein
MEIIDGILHQTGDTCKFDPDLIFHGSGSMNPMDKPLGPVSRHQESPFPINVMAHGPTPQGMNPVNLIDRILSGC